VDMKEEAAWKKFLSLRDKGGEIEPPNLIGVGAARAATTAIYHLLNECPDIYMSPAKELAYFSHFHDKWSEREYLLFFHAAAGQRYRGEISPHYMQSPAAPERIAKICPAARIVIQLRNPLTRAISHYRKHYEHHRIADINEYFRRGLDGIRRGLKGLSFSHPTISMRQSFYYDAVQRYLERFNCAVLFYDDLKNDPKGVVRSLSEWLDVELGSLRAVNVSSPIGGELGPRLRDEFIETFAEDFARTCSLLGRDPAEFTM
jgi:hypothetical protein